MGIAQSKETIVALLLPPVLYFAYYGYVTGTWTQRPQPQPTPSETGSLEEVIASLQHCLNTANKATEVARKDLSVSRTELEALRLEKDTAIRQTNTADYAAEVARKELSTIRAELEDLRLEQSARVREHETVLSAKDLRLEKLERLLDHGYKVTEKEKYKNEGKQKRLVREKNKLENEKIELMQEHKLDLEKMTEMTKESNERSREQIRLLQEQSHEMRDYAAVVIQCKELRQTLEETTTLNAKANMLIDEQKEKIRRLQEMPKPYWVFDERRLWGNGGRLEHEGCVSI